MVSLKRLECIMAGIEIPEAVVERSSYLKCRNCACCETTNGVILGWGLLFVSDQWQKMRDCLKKKNHLLLPYVIYWNHMR